MDTLTHIHKLSVLLYECSFKTIHENKKPQAIWKCGTIRDGYRLQFADTNTAYRYRYLSILSGAKRYDEESC